jgi:hypothetical protein
VAAVKQRKDGFNPLTILIQLFHLILQGDLSVLNLETTPPEVSGARAVLWMAENMPENAIDNPDSLMMFATG